MAKSMSLNSAAGLGGMLKDGHKVFEGVQGAVIKNIEAARAIAGMVQTSLGPNGMNKLVVNHLGKMIVTSDCATIMKELEVQHPAARMLVLASEMQESEFGDNTNFVSSTLISISTASNMISSLIQGYSHSVIHILYLSSSVFFLLCR
jgi:T-complex protein 1 subunit theta